MSYRSILVHVEVDPAAEPRLALAVDLANQFDSALIGVAAEMYEPSTLASGAGYFDGETLVAEAKVVQDDLLLAETKFRATAASVRGDVDWRSGVTMPHEMITWQSRAADLIVAGPGDRSHSASRPGPIRAIWSCRLAGPYWSRPWTSPGWTHRALSSAGRTPVNAGAPSPTRGLS